MMKATMAYSVFTTIYLGQFAALMLTRGELLSKLLEKNTMCESFVHITTEGIENNVNLIAGVANVVFDQPSEGYLLAERNDSYFRRERKLDELLKPSAFGNFKYIPQCSFVIGTGVKYGDLIKILHMSVNLKLGRPNRDYFVFESGRAALEAFRNMEEAQYLRNWMGVYVEGATALSFTNCEAQAVSLIKAKIHEGCETILSGRLIRVATVNGAQFIRLKFDATGKLESAAGINYFMIEEVARRKNFSLLLYTAPGSGMRSKSGVWNGAIGEIMKRDCDVAFAAAITEGRDFAIDYSGLEAWFDRMFWIQAPEVRLSPRALVLPFDALVWSLVLLVTIVASLMFYLLLGLSNTGTESSSSTDLVEHVLEICLRVVLEQSFELRGRWQGGMRLLFSVWVFFNLILTTAYRSKLFFFLTFLTSEWIPRTHEELVFSDYKMVFRTYGGVALNYISRSHDAVHKAMLAHHRMEMEKSSVECILRAVSEERTACLDYDFSGEYAISTNATLRLQEGAKGSKLLVPSIDTDARAMIVWVYPKGSPLQYIFTPALYQFHAAGLYGKWLHDDWNEQKMKGVRWLSESHSTVGKKLRQVEDRLSNVPKPLGFQNFLVVFLALPAVMMIGFCLLIGEVLIHKARKHKNRILSINLEPTRHLVHESVCD